MNIAPDGTSDGREAILADWRIRERQIGFWRMNSPEMELVPRDLPQKGEEVMPTVSASAGKRETQYSPNPPAVRVDTSGRDVYNFVSLNWRLLLGGTLAVLVFIAFDKDR